MECVVKCVVFLSLFLSVQAALFNQRTTQGSSVRLVCENKGSVTWEKGTSKNSRVAIITAEDGEIPSKHRPDPENRFSVLLRDLSLMIRDVSLSDSGIYFCNGVPVADLTVVSSAPPTEDVLIKRTRKTENTEARSTTEATTSTMTRPTSNQKFIESTTATGGVSEVEIGLMFGGVGLAALVFLLATVAAVRVMLHQAWLEGWTAGKGDG